MILTLSIGWEDRQPISLGRDLHPSQDKNKDSFIFGTHLNYQEN